MSYQEGWKERYFVFSACFSLYLLFFTASPRKEDVGEEGEDHARGGMDLGVGQV